MDVVDFGRHTIFPGRELALWTGVSGCALSLASLSLYCLSGFVFSDEVQGR